MTRRLATLLFAANLFAADALVCQDQPAPPPHRPKIGLVLSGGGARGFAHVGVLQVLEELRIPVDVIAGTSMGAIVGGLYASGWSPDNLALLLDKTDWDMAMSDQPVRQERSFRRKQDDFGFLAPLELGFDPATFSSSLPRALLEGRNVESLLEIVTVHVHSVESFDHLPIPFRCVAADLKDGSARVFDSGRLSEAIRASMSIPGLFAPLRLGDRDYVDGGVVDNLPVGVARALGAEVLIVVDVAFGLTPTAAEISVLDITGQVASIMIQENIKRSRDSLDARDVLIDLKLEGIDVLSFDKSKEAITEGLETARARVADLRQFSVDADTWRAFVEGHRRSEIPPRIAAVRIDNDSRLADRLIRAGIRQRLGERLELDDLANDLSRLDGLKVFERVGFEVEPAGGDLTPEIDEDNAQLAMTADDTPMNLVIQAMDRPLGPHYLQFGLDIANDFSDDADFVGKLRHTWLPANSWGGEWRNDLRLGSTNSVFSEWYQPLDSRQLWFVAPSVDWASERDDLLIRGDPVARVDRNVYGAALAAGRVIGNWGEFRAGYRFQHTDADINLGFLSALIGRDIKAQYQDGFFFAQARVDQLDAVDFPRNGVAGHLRYRGGNDGTGQDGKFSSMDGQIQKPLTWGRSTFLLNAEGGYTFKAAPNPDLGFRLGGFRRLSGLKPDELRGVNYALTTLTYFRQVSGRTDVVGSAWFTGASVEAGQTWSNDEAISTEDLVLSGSVFIGARTPVGPVYLGGGLAEEGRSSLYLYVGRGF